MTLYRVAGVSRRHNNLVARFSNTLDRAKVLEKVGHRDIALIELPTPMTKDAACEYLLDKGFDCGDSEIITALRREIDKHAFHKGEARVKGARVAVSESLSPYNTINS